jgi:hypothetical protein
MPVFGADPDRPPKDQTVTTKALGKEVNALANYFAYHPNMRMSQRCGDKDRMILRTFFSRALKRGITVEHLQFMVDKFFQSWGGKYDAPVYAFTSKTMQDTLAKDNDVEVRTDDHWLQWLLDGMPGDDFAEYRRAMFLYADDSLYRYPEVVARLLATESSTAVLADRITQLEAIIQWNLGEPVEGAINYIRDLRGFLPKELATVRRSPLSIRPRSATLKEAVANIPLGER